jgi:hypothetical protein
MFLATILVAAMLGVIRLPMIDFLAPVRGPTINIVPAEETAIDNAPSKQT